MTFEEWAQQHLGAEVWGVNDQEWAKCRECWEAAQLAARHSEEDKPE